VNNPAKHATEHEHHKLVFRTSGSIFCDYVYFLVNNSDAPELLYTSHPTGLKAGDTFIHNVLKESITLYDTEFYERFCKRTLAEF